MITKINEYRKILESQNSVLATLLNDFLNDEKYTKILEYDITDNQLIVDIAFEHTSLHIYDNENTIILTLIYDIITDEDKMIQLSDYKLQDLSSNDIEVTQEQIDKLYNEYGNILQKHFVSLYSDRLIHKI